MSPILEYENVVWGLHTFCSWPAVPWKHSVKKHIIISQLTPPSLHWQIRTLKAVIIVVWKVERGIILMSEIIYGLIGIEMFMFTLRDAYIYHHQKSSIQGLKVSSSYTTTLELFFPAELQTCGIIYCIIKALSVNNFISRLGNHAF